MFRWEWIALGYVSYLVIVAFTDERFVRARKPVVAASAIGWALGAVTVVRSGGAEHLTPLAQIFVPALVLLVGYWLSGRFFVRPMLGVERWLLRVDRQVLERSGVRDRYRGAPRFVHEYFELVYLLVYAVLPAGAATLILGGHSDAVGQYWAVVLLAELSSYAVLPWVQTRPPRTIEAVLGGVSGSQAPGVVLRRVNEAVLCRGSIQVNTLPSGHAAGATAVALAVGASMPAAGAVFAVLAVSNVTATVLGRYHYVVDSALGVLVATAAWGVVAAAA